MSEGVNDRATFCDNETYIGKVERDCSGEPIYMDITNRVTTLNILTEGMGRITSRKNIDIDRKGITRYVLLENAKLYHWHTRSIPMDNISDVHYQNLDDMEITPNDPIFYRGTFDAEAGVDTFLDMKGWGKGFVVINGFNIGCFWEIGPQYTLYVPGGLLKEAGNIIEIFDINPKKKMTCLNTVTEHNF